MIEIRSGAIVLPAICVVAVIAGTSKLDFLEGPAVGIRVTALAAAVVQPFEPGTLLTSLRSVASLAGLRLMQSGKWEVGGGVIESGGWLKAILRVAAEAIATQLALMLILMTGKALPSKTKERPVQIFQFDLGAGGRGNLGCDVTVTAFLLSMLARQGKACLGEVVEVLTVQTNERGRLPVMFLVTTAAIRFANRAFVCARVEPRLSLHPAPDLGVTLQAFKAARPRSKFVTGRTFGQSFQLLVSA